VQAEHWEQLAAEALQHEFLQYNLLKTLPDEDYPMTPSVCDKSALLMHAYGLPASLACKSCVV